MEKVIAAFCLMSISLSGLLVSIPAFSDSETVAVGRTEIPGPSTECTFTFDWKGFHAIYAESEIRNMSLSWEIATYVTDELIDKETCVINEGILAALFGKAFAPGKLDLLYGFHERLYKNSWARIDSELHKYPQLILPVNSTSSLRPKPECYFTGNFGNSKLVVSYKTQELDSFISLFNATDFIIDGLIANDACLIDETSLNQSLQKVFAGYGEHTTQQMQRISAALNQHPQLKVNLP